MSTTGPVIWMTCPVAPAGAAGAVLAMGGCLLCALPGLGAGRDLDHLAGDVGLADLVVLEGQVLEELLGVLGRVLHRHHLAREEARRRLERRLVQTRRDVARQEPLEDGGRDRKSV